MAKYYAVVKRRSTDELEHFKYVKKEKQSNGKFKYYYSWDELKKGVKDKLGYDERDARDKAVEKNHKTYTDLRRLTYKQNEAQSKDSANYGRSKLIGEGIERAQKRNDQAVRERFAAEDAYDKTVLGQLENVKDFGDDIAKSIKSKTQKAKNVVKDILGYDEREAVNDAKQKLKKDTINRDRARKSAIQKSSEDFRPEWNKYLNSKNSVDFDKWLVSHVQEKYSKTPLGKLDQAKSAIDAGTKRVSELINGVGKAIDDSNTRRKVKNSSISKGGKKIEKITDGADEKRKDLIRAAVEPVNISLKEGGRKTKKITNSAKETGKKVSKAKTEAVDVTKKFTEPVTKTVTATTKVNDAKKLTPELQKRFDTGAQALNEMLELKNNGSKEHGGGGRRRGRGSRR